MPSKGQYIRLETKGRRSGKPHSVLVRFVTFDGKIAIFPGNDGRRDWLANIASNSEVRVFGDDSIIEGSAKLRDVGAPGDPLLGAFARKYGNEVVRGMYWGQKRYVEIEPRAESLADDYHELVYADLEAAFDGVAEEYDRHIFRNPMNVWLRTVSVRLMTQIFRPGDVILEIGCGTGTETLSLAERGIKVLASDISSKMLSVLRRKADRAGLGKQVVPVHCRPYMLKTRLEELGYTSVDGAYSTYGAINTEPRLDDLFSDLRSIIRTGGRLVLGVWNRYCLYEMIGYSIRFWPSMAVARFRNPVPVGKSRFCVPSNAYSVAALSKMLSKSFRLEGVHGVGIFLPPSNLVKYLPPSPILDFVKRADVSVEAHFPWNRLGDHFLGIYSKIG